MKRRCRFSFPVSVVVFSIAYIYLSTVFVFIDRWFGLTSSPGIMNAVVFTALAIMSVFNYANAILTDPGRVPSTYIPDVEDVENPIHEIKRKHKSYNSCDVSLTCKQSGDLRYCQKCSHYKPPRAHHCRVCKRCVLRMDHHCIWINNCVGHANYKVFIIFVTYAVITCIYSLVLLVGSLANDGLKEEEQNGGSYRTIYVVSGILLLPLSITLGILLGWHIYLILHNKTTIEYHEGVRALWLAEKGGNIYKHPYDLGPYENLTTCSLRFLIMHQMMMPYSSIKVADPGPGTKYPLLDVAHSKPHREMDADNHNPSQPNRYHPDGVCKTNIIEWNKKRKLQTDQWDMLRPKHKFWVRRFSSEYASKFEENPELESMEKLMVNGKTEASILDDISEPESAEDSNSFTEDSDTVMSVNEEAKLEIDCAKSYLHVNWDGYNVKTSSDVDEGFIEREYNPSYHDADIQALKNLEEHLLALESSTDHVYSGHAKDSCEHSIDKEFQEIFHVNGVNPDMYVLSSARWNVNQEAQSSTRTPTIDQEFEEYFSMLMI
ncbi:putative protein S-acyltransferase 16 [Senna tora]|uniref:S-acyltransferase n=1 Tax=Senna tora TaxID=362788 RepID=A0A835CJH0_9FABA|nr:putative protein S-acyltransferase 16 [Senna tora]